MNPRYMLPQYPNPYQYRLPSHGAVNYVGWPNYSDLGLQLVYIQPYPQMPMLPCEPLIYAPPIPPQPAWRPRMPTYTPHIYQTVLGQPLVTAQPQNQNHHMSRTGRSFGNRGRIPESMMSHTKNNIGSNDTQPKSTFLDSKINPPVKSAIGEVSVFQQLRSNTTLYRPKRKVRRRRRKIPDRDKCMVTVGSAELSSINMEGTQTQLKNEPRTIENEIADLEYETCEEEDVTPVVIDSQQNLCEQVGSRGTDNHLRSVPDGRVSRDSSEFTSICNNKSYSHIAFNRDLVSVKSATITRGKTFVVRRTEKKLSVSHDVFQDHDTAGGGNQFFSQQNCSDADDDYWAAISSVESLWDATNEEIGKNISQCDRKNPICRCKKCIEKSTKKTRPKSSVVSTPTKGSIPSPELWWDRSEYQWPTADTNDGNNNLRGATGGVKVVDRSDEYVVVDLGQDHGIDEVANENPADADASSKLDQSHEEQVSNGDSSIVPKRRLLSVDWESISRSCHDLESSSTFDQNLAQPKSLSITELDKAIVERGPVTTEPFSLPALLQASLNDTLRRLKSCSKDQTTEAQGGLLQKSENLTSERRTVAEFLRTAFTSNDAWNDAGEKGEVKTQNWTAEVQKVPVPAPRSKTVQANQDVFTETKRKPPTPSYTRVNAPRLSLLPTELTPRASFGCSVRRSNSCPRKPTGNRKNDVPEVLTMAKSLLSLDVKEEAHHATDVHGSKSPNDDKNKKIQHEGDVDCTISKDMQKDTGQHATVKSKSKSKFRDGFSFPMDSDIFRRRACAISNVNGSTPVGVRDRRLPTLGQESNTNKKIYEKSKPMPRKDSADPRRSRTAPSSPTHPTASLRRISMSMSDIHDAMLRAAAADENGSFRNFIDNQAVPNKNQSSTSQTIRKESQNPSQDASISVRANKVDGRKKKTVRSRDTRLPTGLPLNSMLNDTIRRKFRERASPATIFTISQNQSVGKDTIIVRSPSIDDWSTILLQTTTGAAKSSNIPVAYYGAPVPNPSKPPRSGKNGNYPGVPKPPRYMRLPVIVYSPEEGEPRLLMHRRPKHASAHTMKRRSSLSSLHYSVLSKGVRQRRRREVPVQQQQTLKGGTCIAVNKTYPAFSITQSTADNSPEFSKLERSDKSLQTSVDIADAKSTLRTKAEIEGPTVAPAPSTSETITQDSLPVEGEASTSKDGGSTAVDTFTLVEADGAAVMTDEDAEGKTAGGKKHKESFLKRFMKPKKWSKSVNGESKTDDRRSTSDSRRAPGKAAKSATRKPSRQERIRTNFAVKKNRILGRDSKVRSKLPVASDDTATGDVNGNSETLISAPLRVRNVIKRRLTALSAAQSDVVSASPHRPKEDRSVRSALYKPTFLCMAAIEAPAYAAGEGSQQPASPSHDVVGFEDSESRDAFNIDSDPFPAAIRQRRNTKSVGTPGVRINSETGDILEAFDTKSHATFLSSTKILEHDSSTQK